MFLARRDKCQKANWRARFGSLRRAHAAGAGLMALLGVGTSSCGETQSMLDPVGPRAAQISDLWWIMFTLGSIVFVVVMLLTAIAIWKNRDAEEPLGAVDTESYRRDLKFVVAGGFVMPVVVLVLLFFLTMSALSALSAPDEEPELTIEITGHQWWWEARYPGQDVVTANEIHFPVGQPVQLRLESADVIHSLWVPQVQGKLDMIPGQVTTMWIEADEPGTYRGQCAEFCGIQHANMALHMVADTPEQFSDWIARQSADADQPTDSAAQQGQEVFQNAGCTGCHTVSGTNAVGIQGPDLTHFASREWIAAGTLRNTTGNLSLWIADPQHVKPGNKMPAVGLTGEDLANVVAYLETLE